MILANQFKCVIPSGNAIKEGSALHCTGFPPTPPAASEVWAAWIDALASWAGILLTIVLARYAWKAWKEAQRANGLIKEQLTQSETALERELQQAESGLRTQITSTESGLQTQIDSALELSMRERELEQLQAYCESIMSFVNNCASVENPDDLVNADFEQRKGETTIRWAAWSMYLLAKDSDLRNATAVLHGHYLDQAANIQSIALQFHRTKTSDQTMQLRLKQIAAISHNQDLLFNALGKYVAKLQYIAVQASDHDLHRLEIIGDAATLKARQAP